jgi:cysteinyl-tRNA synthetase
VVVLVTALGLGMLACEPAPGAPPASGPGRRAWSSISSWAYWLDSPDAAALSASTYELVVTDELEPSEVAAIAAGRCRPRVVSYLSIGEAEEYRWYWQAGWRPGRPAWLLGENADWEGNHGVRFWDPAWQQLVLESVDRIVDAGYHGVYLDRIDAYADPALAGHQRDMVWLVQAISARARARSPLGEDFGVFAQNAEELVSVPGYASVLTGIGREETYVVATDEPTSDDDRRWVEAQLDQVRDQSSGHLVLTVDYADDSELAAVADRSARAKGYIPYVTTVDLDRLSPRPAPPCA